MPGSSRSSTASPASPPSTSAAPSRRCRRARRKCRSPRSTCPWAGYRWAALMPVELCYATVASPVAAPSGRRVPRRRAVVRWEATALALMGEKTEYRDGPLERAFMGLLTARKMEKFAGRKKKPGPGGEEEKKAVWEWDYESFVDVWRRVMVGRSRAQQQEAVRDVLLSMLPPGDPEQFKKLFPSTR